MLRVDAVEVAGWDPAILLSDAVTPSPRTDQFLKRACAAYLAPPLIFEDPQAMRVGGRHFAVVTQAGGLVEASVHTLPRAQWARALGPNTGTSIGPSTPVLVAASAGYGNYYHWMTETVGAALLHRLLRPETRIPLLIPPLDQSWKRDALAAFGIDNPLLVLPSDDVLALDAGVLTSVTGPGHSFAPHPAMLDLLRQQLPQSKGSRDRKIYVSRLDAGDRRRMVNETELCGALTAIGFEIVTAGQLDVAAQAALFRDARLIVAPHGAALTNLIFCNDGADGPVVIELFQEDYLNRCFLKLCQGKRLSYRALINPCVSAGDHHHQSTWRADIPFINRVIGEPEMLI